jgi:hypothetical protein
LFRVQKESSSKKSTILSYYQLNDAVTVSGDIWGHLFIMYYSIYICNAAGSEKKPIEYTNNHIFTIIAMRWHAHADEDGRHRHAFLQSSKAAKLAALPD